MDPAFITERLEGSGAPLGSHWLRTAGLVVAFALLAFSIGERLLPRFRSSEHCPQLGGCRPFPRSEGSIERIRILVAEQKCHFRDIHLVPIEILARQFLP